MFVKITELDEVIRTVTAWNVAYCNAPLVLTRIIILLVGELLLSGQVSNMVKVVDNVETLNQDSIVKLFVPKFTNSPDPLTLA